VMVRKKGLEPSRYCYRQPLTLVDLLRRCERLRILLTDPELKRTLANARNDSIRTHSHTGMGPGTMRSRPESGFRTR